MGQADAEVGGAQLLAEHVDGVAGEGEAAVLREAEVLQLGAGVVRAGGQGDAAVVGAAAQDPAAGGDDDLAVGAPGSDPSTNVASGQVTILRGRSASPQLTRVSVTCACACRANRARVDA